MVRVVDDDGRRTDEAIAQEAADVVFNPRVRIVSHHFGPSTVISSSTFCDSSASIRALLESDLIFSSSG